MAVSEPARVVLADDLPDARELTRLTLERTGRFRVVGEAGDGAEAIEMVTRHRPDLLLLDLAMPRVDGLRALPAIRSASPETKVVVLSGFDRSRLAHRAMAGGAVAYLEKTVSTRLLVDELLAVSGLLDAVEEALAEARVRFAEDLTSGQSARRFVAAALDQWRASDVIQLVQLLVTELVTNSVVHARSDVDVAVMLGARNIRVEVADSDPVLPEPRDVDETATSGRGLALVRDLSERWGAEARADGKVIWFEVARPEAESHSGG
ncbi:MAG: response regulator [Actinobacteria bacterium]|nr:MAG: response regulator [Actinomycetota bacterium]